MVYGAPVQPVNKCGMLECHNLHNRKLFFFLSFFLLQISFRLQTNTFQGVLITDGRVSYTVFIYDCGRMEWSGGATIGFNTDGTFFVNHPLSQMDNTSEIACLNAPETVWSNVVYNLGTIMGMCRSINGPLSANWRHVV